MKLIKFQKKYTSPIALLIVKTYKKYNCLEYYKKSAVKKYLDEFDPKKNSIETLYLNFKKSSIFFIAKENNKVIGMIRGKPGKISNLFVNGSYHRKGVGKKLVRLFESEALSHGSTGIKIRSSMYAIPFYQTMGYKKSTGVRNYKGLKIWPMRKIFKNNLTYVKIKPVR